MARKRGGIPGLYDRNKGKFRTVGTLIGTGLGALVGGPAGAKIGGTLAGAAFRGFDRPGESGIGFDVKQGLRGAAEGYGTAALATGAYGGVKSMLAPSGSNPTGSNPSVLAKQTATSGMDKVRGALTGARNFMRENKDLISMAGKGIMSAMPDRGEDAAMMRAETERMAFEDEKAQREARQRALQQYFMPLLGQIQQERQGMSFGPMYRG